MRLFTSEMPKDFNKYHIQALNNISDFMSTVFSVTGLFLFISDC